MLTFDSCFAALTGHPPFPWQRALYDDWFSQGKVPPSCNLPTGLGKTSVIAVWLIAWANGAAVPRRLVYVVNRRTVVDQTTDEVQRYRTVMGELGPPPEVLFELTTRLCSLTARRHTPLALSTLRGQFADNREWSADPSRPAVICGTVDMIGSRLLFSGYGVGFKGKPLHAGFLGQDALLVHDEAHLEPPFQRLIDTIEQEQGRCKDFRPLRVMELTATSRGSAKPFGLSEEDRKHPTVIQRIEAVKTVHWTEASGANKVVEEVVKRALSFKDSCRAVLVFVRSVADVKAVQDKLPKNRVVTLTGTMRGKERDELVENPIFRRFLPDGQSDAETTYLVCTSAGEVGVNISADHLVCDLTTFESMAQRFGRVNRFGQRPDTEIHVVHPAKIEEKDEAYRTALERTLALLKKLRTDAAGKPVGNPAAMGELVEAAIREGTDGAQQLDRAEALRRYVLSAYAPPPTILPATDILFDAWALTSIRGKLPGRPPVEPYLHGLPTDWQPPETQVAWRTEVERIVDDLLNEHPPVELLGDYPLKPHEMLKEPSHRAFKQLQAMAKRLADRTVPVWLYDEDREQVIITTLQALTAQDKEQIEGKTVILPPSAGGLEGGMLNGAAASDGPSLDVADEWFRKDRTGERVRHRKRLPAEDAKGDPEVDEMHPVRAVTFPGADDDDDEQVWKWFVLDNEGDKAAKAPVWWQVHVVDVEREAKAILNGLGWSGDLRTAVETAARLHDHGKRRKLFQTVLGNTDYPRTVLAKSGKNGGRMKELYRHEFGSLLDVRDEVTGEHRDLILHLIAAHHGRGRPHFDPDEAFDPEHPHAAAQEVAAETPRRFARLQRRYGRWGLAYLESLLRAADWAASANPSEFVQEGQP